MQKNNDKDYPIILLTDGGYAFPLVSSISRQMSGGGKITEPIIIGMSYSKEESWQMSRTRDYTPTYAPNETNSHGKKAREVSGGAEAYATFLQDELIPFLSKKYRIDQSRKIFAGHSFGGLFGSYMVKAFPNAFDYYIISDPSLWYHDGSIFGIESIEPNKLSQKPEVLIVAGHRPVSTSPTKTVSDSMEKNAQRLHTQLQSNPSFYGNVKIEILDGEIHETIFPISVSHGMLQFLGR